MDYDSKAITAAAAKKAGSYYRLAKMLEVSTAAVSQWKTGTKHPNGHHLLAMLKLAGKLTVALVIVTSATLPEPARAALRDTVYYVKRTVTRWAAIA